MFIDHKHNVPSTVLGINSHNIEKTNNVQPSQTLHFNGGMN